MTNGEMGGDLVNRSYGLQDLLCEQVRDLYDASDRFENELMELLEAAVSSELSDLLRELRSSYADFRNELVEVCADLGVPHGGVTCEAMRGLVRECKDTTQSWDESATRDAAIIANAQRVCHYAIAGFGTAGAFARTLKLGNLVATFKRLRRSAKEADKRLTRVARGSWFSPGVNEEAAAVS